MAEQSGIFYRHMGVYGVCVDDARILVIRKRLGPYTGKYDLPGGRLEERESLAQGIRRELREETGYSVRGLRSIGACDFSVLWTLRDGTVEHLHHIAILYEAAVDSNGMPAAIEAFEEQDSDGALWLPLVDAAPDNSSPLVLQAVEWIRTGALSAYEGVTFDYRRLT